MLKTAVVILNWNGIRFLKLFLGDVFANTADENTSVYLADNGSDDGSAEWVKENYKDVKLIKLSKNYGFAEGYDLALKQIESKYYVLLNSDIEVSEGWLEPMIKYLDDNADVAACQPKILSYNSREYFEYAGAAGGFIDKFGYPLCRGRIFSHTEKDTGQYDDQIDIFWSTGACMAVRSEAWKKCGGFDPAFFAHMEEIDLCWRFQNAGYRIAYIPKTSVYHVGGGTLAYDSPFKTYLNFRNNLFLLYKNLPGNALRSTLFKRKILDGAAAIFFFMKGQFRSSAAVWRAHMAFYRTRTQLMEKRNAINPDSSSGKNPHILNKSIVFEFYVKGIRTYTSLVTKKTDQ